MLGDVHEDLVVPVVGCGNHHCVTHPALEELDVAVEHGDAFGDLPEAGPRTFVGVRTGDDRRSLERQDVRQVLHRHVTTSDDPVPDLLHSLLPGTEDDCASLPIEVGSIGRRDPHRPRPETHRRASRGGRARRLRMLAAHR